MEIVIHPDELSAAAAAITAAATRLEAASIEFRHAVYDQLPALGMRAAAASAHGVIATDRAVEAFADDLRALAQAVRGLAAHYNQVDRSAVPAR